MPSIKHSHDSKHPPLAGFVPVEALTGVSRPRFWRTLEEQAGLLDAAGDDCDAEGTPTDELSRRRFLQLAAASFAFAGVTGCTRQPTERILPYVNPPANLTPGNPKYYASAVPGPCGLAQGVIVESHMGRPTKIEGNPAHPASLGASSVHAQASILDLYDPDRSKTVMHLGIERSWDDFRLAFTAALGPLQAQQGAGLYILTGSVVSPTLASQLRAVLHAMPKAKWHQYEPAGHDNIRAGAEMAFGRPVNTLYGLDQADVVLSLDSDFLTCGEPSTRLAHDYTARRTRGDRTDMNRLYVVESTMTATGGKADHRLPLRYADVDDFACQLAAALNVPGAPRQAQPSPWARAVAQDLLAHRGHAAILVGAQQSPSVHALAHAMNAALGNVGTTVHYTEALEAQPSDSVASLRALAQDIQRGAAQMLLILGQNPVYDAPVDLRFDGMVRKVPTAIHMGLHRNETSDQCAWQLPESHFLESWGDARGYDGTVSIIQPLIDPLYDSRSQIELLDLILQQPARTGYQIVRDNWQTTHRSNAFEDWWRSSVCNGVVAGSALPEITPKLNAQWAASIPPVAKPAELEIVFRPDVYLHDGRYANNTWLQELPQPMTKLTWDNAIYLSPRTAKQLDIAAQQRVRMHYREHQVEGSAWILPGQPDGSVTVHLGWGRTHAGRAGDGAGFSAYRIRTSDAMWSAGGLRLEKIDHDYPLATVQMHQTMEGRTIVVSDEVARFRREPDFVSEETKHPRRDETLYPNWNYTGHAWGMAIDLTRCVNCNACVVACQAENNIPVVGKQQVLARRAMHWLRIDVYYEGDLDNPRAAYQPIPCMQCEDAPCEVVCPVQATNHSSDGLNDMVYNRCVGTRYCSNNCPYKVRRFNYLLYQDWVTESIKLQRNPDVSVRSRGVMEKCTYCVQRIREAEISAQVEQRPVRNESIQTACQQSCPTRAIIFGDINQRESEVVAMKSSKLNYELLGDLNTRPRTTYLAELRNPNPQMREA